NFAQTSDKVKSQEGQEPDTNGRDVNWAEFSLKYAERDVRDQQAVSNIDKHVERFPNRRAQVGEPEVVTGGRHQHENNQGDETEWLEGYAGKRASYRCGGKNAKDRVSVATSVVRKHHECGVD